MQKRPLVSASKHERIFIAKNPSEKTGAIFLIHTHPEKMHGKFFSFIQCRLIVFAIKNLLINKCPAYKMNKRNF